jgi:membrane-associated phospholipid phosphatase
MFGSNNILKFIGKSFLGSLGERPSGANSCGIIFDGIKSISYGMPSGHSQIAWAVASYLIVKILIDDVMIDKTDKTDKTNIQNINNIYKIIKSLLFILILFIIASYISYSRVIIEGCHTWMQVIIGGCIGAIMGVSVFVIEKYIFKN